MKFDLTEKHARVKTLENQLDQLVYKLYDLTPQRDTERQGIQ
ncbi:MAG: hypothetical protein P1P80_09990 [ANME-2 cluster archaeon]|nr:hypothetical protein [ANME-2 cluster archaeon]